MRLVEDDREVRYGKVEQLDLKEVDRLEKSIGEIVAISKALWVFIRASPRFTDEI
jgi:hypothetical protein